jgi:hypothetical protein
MAVQGRSWKRGEVALDEIRKLTEPFGDSAAALFDDDMMQGCEYDVVVVDGPLKLAGDFYTFDHGLCGLIVRGDLTVTGHYMDCDDPATGVYVLGDMHVGSAMTNGELGVRGSLTADRAVIGFYNDYAATIGGDVHTPCFAPENHFFEIGGKLDARVVVGYGAEYRVPEAMRAAVKAVVLAPSKYREVIAADVLVGADEEEPELDDQKLRERAKAGLAIVVGVPGSPASGAKPVAKREAAPKSKPKAKAQRKAKTKAKVKAKAKPTAKAKAKAKAKPKPNKRR